MYYARNRFYHPSTSWLQRDPLGYVNSQNLYQYVNNSPLTFNDPFGNVGPGPLAVCAANPVVAIGGAVAATAYVGHYWIGQPIVKPVLQDIFYWVTDPWVNQEPAVPRCHCYCPDYRPPPFPAEPVPDPGDPSPVHPYKFTYYGYITVYACLHLGCRCGPDPAKVPPWGKGANAS